jgi:hypothetical protein
MDITCFASIYGLREKFNVWHGELGRVASDVNFNSWHEIAARQASEAGLFTAALPTLTGVTGSKGRSVCGISLSGSIFCLV